MLARVQYYSSMPANPELVVINNTRGEDGHDDDVESVGETRHLTLARVTRKRRCLSGCVQAAFAAATIDIDVW